MKKFLGLTLSALMLTATLAGCGGKEEITSLDYVNLYSSDLSNMDYVLTSLAVDHEHNANFVDGLVENDSYGNFVGALAESWEPNEDATEFTFKLREGVQWVDYEGNEIAEVTAEDFVTGLRHAADFASETAWLVEGLIKNFYEYEMGQVEWEEVGVEAVDKYTVKYTLEYAAPYFYTFGSYNILMPINKEFLESKGEGCKLGAPDKTTCTFGAVEPSSILYNGGYILNTFDAKSQITYVANPSYWDAEHVYVQNIKLIYTDGSDEYASIKGFEEGTYVSSSLNTSWADFDTYKEKYADNYYVTLPNTTNFYVLFNYNRTNYSNTTKTTDAAKENAREAILNENFRKAFRAGFDRVGYQAVDTPRDVAVDMQRNIASVPNLVTTSDGTEFGTLVEKYYAERAGEEVKLGDGADVFYNPEKAMEYVNAAKADGIEFPVTLDLPTYESSKSLVAQCNALKQSVEKATEGNILINVVLMDYDTLVAACYGVAKAEDCDFDINTFTGWGPDYPDPKTFLDLFSTSEGLYLTSVGLHRTTEENYNAGDEAAIKALGLDEYETLYQAAKAITDDNDKRYDAFAKCDALLTESAIVISTGMDARGYAVSRIVPFTKSYSNTGISEYKYKFMVIQEEIVDKEQYDAAYNDWLEGRGA